MNQKLSHKIYIKKVEERYKKKKKVKELKIVLDKKQKNIEKCK